MKSSQNTLKKIFRVRVNEIFKNRFRANFTEYLKVDLEINLNIKIKFAY